MTVDLVLNNAKACLGNRVVDCNIAVDEGKIFRIGKEATMPRAETRLDLTDLLVLPGLIDAHVHLRDEAKAYKEDFSSGTAAAAAGGFTTVLDMPNNDPVTMSTETLKNRMEKAEKTIFVNVGFYSEFPNSNQEIGLIVKQGAVAFKLFMVEQVGGLNIEDDDAILEAFRMTERSRTTVAVHAEDRTLLRKAVDELKKEGRNDIDAYLQAHSEEVEAKAIERLTNIARQTSVHLHFCHVATSKGLKRILDAKKIGTHVTCETTPHHLLLSSQDLKRTGTIAITTPPFQEKKHMIALWSGIDKGWVDILASDHAPQAIEEKVGETVWSVKAGIPGLETTLPLLLTEVQRGRLSIGRMVRLMSEGPAEVFRLKGKGGLKEGNDADITVVDPKREFRIDSAKFQSKAKYSPFHERRVSGKTVKTFVGGQLVMDEGDIIVKEGCGQVINGDCV